MKFSLGKYPKQFDIFKITNLLTYIGASEDFCNNLAHKFHRTKLGKHLDSKSVKKYRKIKMKISDCDLYDPSDTISIFIAYYLQEIKNHCNIILDIDDYDIPRDLYDKYKNASHFYDFKSDYVFDEIIGAFCNNAVSINDSQKFIIYNEEEKEERINNGLRLFKKYINQMWI